MRIFEPMEGRVLTDGGYTWHCGRIGWGQLEPIAGRGDGAYRQSCASTLVDRGNIKKQEENTVDTSLVATMRDPFSIFYYNLVTIR